MTDYTLFLNAHSAVMTRYICDKCGKVKEVPHYLFQEGFRDSCVPKKKTKPKVKIITKRVASAPTDKRKESGRFAMSKACIIDTVKYDSLTKASQACNVSRKTLNRWFERYPDRCRVLG